MKNLLRIVLLLVILFGMAHGTIAQDPEPTKTPAWSERDGENPNICIPAVLVAIVALVGKDK